MSSLLTLALGFEKDLKMSDVSRLRAFGLLVGFWSVDLRSVWEIDVPGFPLDESRSEDFDSCVPFGVSWDLALIFSLLLTSGAAGGCMSGRFAVLRFKQSD